MDRLRLEIRDLTSPARWRWLLAREGTDQALADHQVDLAAEARWERGAFADLHAYLRWHAVPDRRAASEAELVAQVGVWAGHAVLGEAIGAAITAAAPVSVRVVLPPEAAFLLSWPLELAHAAGRPLAARGDITLVYDLTGSAGGRRPAPSAATATGAGDALRMLAVFSLPAGGDVLALRRERYELTRLVRGIAARQRRRVQLTVVQYGATRDRLARLAEAGGGWDILHLSGHGSRGVFLLEQPDGSPDPVPAAALLDLLAPLRHRLRVAVVSACESAAATTAETLRLVGLADQATDLEQAAGLARPPDGQEATTALARRAAEGGSWHVQVSLSQTCMWYQRLGDDNDAGAADPGDIEPFTAVMDTGDFGAIRYLTPAVHLSETPPRWDLPPARVGAHEPAWLPR